MTYLKDMREWIRGFPSGYNFVIATEQDGVVTNYYRDSQPCYGELRKYKKTHKEEATKTESRPGDLYDPFPDGKPVAVGLCFTTAWEFKDYLNMNKYLKYLFGKFSPWRRGFKDVEYVKKEDTDIIIGVIIKDCSIDPTVMVNLFNWTCTTGIHRMKDFYRLREKGWKWWEITTYYMIFRSGMYSSGFNPVQSYYNSGISSPYYIKKGLANDLTGGTLEERFDYERKRLHDVFSPLDMSTPAWKIKEGYCNYSGFKGDKSDEEQVRKYMNTLAKTHPMEA